MNSVTRWIIREMWGLNLKSTSLEFQVNVMMLQNSAHFNAEVIAYCEQEQLTFTRGQPGAKNDQAHVERATTDPGAFRGVDVHTAIQERQEQTSEDKDKRRCSVM